MRILFSSLFVLLTTAKNKENVDQSKEVKREKSSQSNNPIILVRDAARCDQQWFCDTDSHLCWTAQSELVHIPLKYIWEFSFTVDGWSLLINRTLILNDLFLVDIRKKVTSHQHTVGEMHHAFLFQYIIIEKYSCRLEPAATASYQCLYIAEMVTKTIK